MSTLILFLTFSGLTLAGLLREEGRRRLLGRSGDEWLLDLAGLFIQGVVVPALPFVTAPLLAIAFPTLDRSLELNAPQQFLLSFVAVDYLYYWNHRVFHSRRFWALHRVHHSARHLDVLVTSRNSVLTSFLFVYVWAQTMALFLLEDGAAFSLGLALTFALDLWRHSGAAVPPGARALLAPVLILPAQHVLHHSLPGRNRNFGANLCWWDKLHGTFSPEEVPNRNLEKSHATDVWRELFAPWRCRP
jgi:sterol desaturase/sphingolipid hydroxylase (fatty acid hydroxylase superfamily)